eukprot:CAMPEP_0115839210 /NCGR_PEP_ID=MMETSP0287-20121206/6135_1 /TAXON_ID=412157 /ORGANISM="Chrysochromulina rotalis, Strain UIO044" /LENGTH=177 /DNA_ID=CAMNT_0003292777 /DNA_START=139 /DNA_END=672 /DNA_ORIENTATION=-
MFRTCQRLNPVVSSQAHRLHSGDEPSADEPDDDREALECCCRKGRHEETDAMAAIARGIADLVQYTPHAKGANATKSWVRKDVASQEEANEHTARTLDHVLERSVGAIVLANPPIIIKNHRAATLANHLVDKGIGPHVDAYIALELARHHQCLVCQGKEIDEASGKGDHPSGGKSVV